MSNELTKIGERLIEIRKEAHLTQQEVADKIDGLTVQMISSYETGKQKPGIENLAKFSKFFNVSLDYLCFGKNIVKDTKLHTYSDLFREIVKLSELGIFEIQTSYSGIGSKSDTRYFSMTSRDKILVEFIEKFKKLESCKEILGNDIYNLSLESLVSKYIEIKLNIE